MNLTASHHRILAVLRKAPPMSVPGGKLRPHLSEAEIRERLGDPPEAWLSSRLEELREAGLVATGDGLVSLADERQAARRSI